jgi:hypothetical protein
MAAHLPCDRAQLRQPLARLGAPGSGSTARAREHGQRLDGASAGGFKRISAARLSAAAR